MKDNDKRSEICRALHAAVMEHSEGVDVLSITDAIIAHCCTFISVHYKPDSKDRIMESISGVLDIAFKSSEEMGSLVNLVESMCAQAKE